MLKRHKKCSMYHFSKAFVTSYRSYFSFFRMLIFLLFLDIVSIVSPKLLDLSDALDSKDETGKKTGTGFEQFFGIPLGSDAAQFEKYGVYDPKSTRQQL